MPALLEPIMAQPETIMSFADITPMVAAKAADICGGPMQEYAVKSISSELMVKHGMLFSSAYNANVEASIRHQLHVEQETAALFSGLTLEPLVSVAAVVLQPRQHMCLFLQQQQQQ